MITVTVIVVPVLAVIVVGLAFMWWRKHNGEK